MQTNALSLLPLCKPLHCFSVASCPAASEPSPGPAANRVVLVGRLTAEPELKYTSTGIPYTRLGIATHTRPEPECHIVTWRRVAEAAGKYLAKGRLVYVEGGKPMTARRAGASRSLLRLPSSDAAPARG